MAAPHAAMIATTALVEACDALLCNARKLHGETIELIASRARRVRLFATLRRTVATAREEVASAEAAVHGAMNQKAVLDTVMQVARSRASTRVACRRDVEAAVEACGGRDVDLTTLTEDEKVVVEDAWRCVDVELADEPAGMHELVEVSVFVVPREPAATQMVIKVSGPPTTYPHSVYLLG